MSEVLIRLHMNDTLNSLNLSFGQELKSSYSNESLILLKNMFRKNGKKKNLIIAQKHLIVCPLPETEDHINSFQVDVPSPYHLRTSENLWSLIFLGG